MNRGAQPNPSPLSSLICGGHLPLRGKDVVVRPTGTADWLMVFTLRGLGHFTKHGQPDSFFDHRTGIISLTPPHTALDVIGYPGWNHYWAHFLPRPHWTGWLDWPESPAGCRILSIPPGTGRRTVAAAFSRIVQCTTTSISPNREEFAMLALEEILLTCNALKPGQRHRLFDAKIDGCLKYIAGHFSESIRLEDLAQASRQSVSRISHLFRQATGFPPMQYLEHLRLERAMRLLTGTSMPVKQIAAEVGFDDPLYFTKRFHRQTGYSPRAYREKSHRHGILRHPGAPLNEEDRRLLRGDQ